MPQRKVLVMGVSGSGKSTLAARLAQELDATLIEGDEHHPPGNREKMRDGIALEDSDRVPWLEHLGKLVAARRDVVLTCSALKCSYRERLRAAEPGLRIVYLEISLAEAHCRVLARPGHYFPADLVASQFATLEVPAREPGVLHVSAIAPIDRQLREILSWLAGSTAAQGFA